MHLRSRSVIKHNHQSGPNCHDEVPDPNDGSIASPPYDLPSRSRQDGRATGIWYHPVRKSMNCEGFAITINVNVTDLMPAPVALEPST